MQLFLLPLSMLNCYKLNSIRNKKVGGNCMVQLPPFS